MAVPRRKTRKVTLGDERHGFVSIGGDAPVSVQSMTAGYTHDIDACVAEIQKLAAAGADIVRVAVPEKKDTAALKEILPQVSVPIVADVHFHFQRALEVIDAYKVISERFDYPLHLGVTHAGPKETGTIRSVAPLAHLLASGVGDTIRISYASDPVYEVKDGLELLYCLGLRTRVGAELIACPTCGRIQVDLFKLVQDVRKQLEKEIQLPIKVAVMGCVVNGPGECEGADIAIFAGDRRGFIYVQGEMVERSIPEEDLLPRLLQHCRDFQAKVERGEAQLGEKKVDVLPPDPIGELGSGWGKIKDGEKV